MQGSSSAISRGEGQKAVTLFHVCNYRLSVQTTTCSFLGAQNRAQDNLDRVGWSRNGLKTENETSKAEEEDATGPL